ncbi:hypothetical protein [Kitasatospora sp. NPDC058218]|uniref:hypothetical protein n=1 Tax=Kitasatospora sp. NPDC058218 TaxID=3346385 RepID=UPI0036DB391D
MGSSLTRATVEQRRAAADALDDLRAVLALGGVALPSVGIDWQAGRATGDYRIDLGAVRPDVIVRLVELLRKGLRHERQEELAGQG